MVGTLTIHEIRKMSKKATATLRGSMFSVTSNKLLCANKNDEMTPWNHGVVSYYLVISCHKSAKCHQIPNRNICKPKHTHF